MFLFVLQFCAKRIREMKLVLPMEGVARVWRPASWAGPNPSRKPVKCLSDASFTPGKIRLRGEDRGLKEALDQTVKR